MSEHKLYDFWGEAPRLFGSAGNAGCISDYLGGFDGQREDRNMAISVDRVERCVGDFSIRFDTTNTDKNEKFGFYPGPYQQFWQLNEQWELLFYLRSEGCSESVNWKLVLVDGQGKSVQRQLVVESNGQWQKQRFKLKDWESIAEIDLAQLRYVEITGLVTPAQVWVDGVHFYHPSTEQIIGVSDKTLEQFKAEAEASQQQRADEAMLYIAQNHDSNRNMTWCFCRLAVDDDVAEVNKVLLQMLSTQDKGQLFDYGLHNYFYQSGMWMLCKMYYMFGHNSTYMPGRLYADTEKALLELLWETNLTQNNIFLAQKDTWWIIGSENHDLENIKVPCLLAAQIFMNEPEYAHRDYPNYTVGDGGPNWFERKTGPDKPRPEEAFSPTKYYPADHFAAWRSFFLKYFAERARKGFFQEVCSPGYGRSTFGAIWSIYEFCQDADLKEQVKKFIDLVLVEFVQDQIGGVRGGAKTRCGAKYAVHPESDSYYGLTHFLLGGSGKLEAIAQLGFVVFSDYRLPDYLRKMALDRVSLGEYAYISRKPGEANDEWPRPLGTEHTIMLDHPSRFVRYSWVTPDYILGTQMDHPGAVYAHTSQGSGWHGMIFAKSTRSRIFPTSIDVQSNGDWVDSGNKVYRSVQHENVMIAQQLRSWTHRNPQWFPAGLGSTGPSEYGIYFGGEFDQLLEQAGWIFIQEGNACLAIRVVQDQPWDMDRTNFRNRFYESVRATTRSLAAQAYTWNADRTMVMFNDKWNPVIFEAGRKNEYATLAKFADCIMHNELTLHNAFVGEQGYYMLTYTSCRGNNFYFNAANLEMPMVNGRYVDYSYPKVFDSPYLQSDYDSGVVRVECGDETVVLDFNSLEKGANGIG